mmetsp:Transcript_96841/g.202342  ORF Transcript_96841/g.202342 Transcript_96841/m.202342 type:complete len:241 (+) Transcript_96841:2361-3083(+)
MSEGDDGDPDASSISMLVGVSRHSRDVPCHATAVLVADVGVFQQLGEVGMRVGLVGFLELLWGRAVGDQECDREVGSLQAFDPPKYFVGNDGASPLSKPNCVDTVPEAQDASHNLGNHGVEVCPTLPRHHPEVHLLIWFDESPTLHVEGGVTAELWCEEQYSVVGVAVGNHVDLHDDVARRIPTCELHSLLVIANPSPFYRSHLVRCFSERVLEGLILSSGPGPRTTGPVEGIPLAFVLI